MVFGSIMTMLLMLKDAADNGSMLTGYIRLLLLQRVVVMTWVEKGGLDELIGRSINLHPLPGNQQAADNLKAEKAGAATAVNMGPIPGFKGSPVNDLFDRAMIFGKNSLDIARAEIQTTGHSDRVFKVTDGSGRVTSYPLGPETRYRYFTDTSSNHVYALRGILGISG